MQDRNTTTLIILLQIAIDLCKLKNLNNKIVICSFIIYLTVFDVVMRTFFLEAANLVLDLSIVQSMVSSFRFIC